MSFFYRVVESSCFFLNQNANGLIKRAMHDFMENNKKSDAFPGSFTHLFQVKRKMLGDFPVYEMQNRQGKVSDKTILFLAGGGGMARPMALHYDVAARLVKKTGATLYFAYYPLAPEYNVAYALDWLEKLYKAIEKRKRPEHMTIVGDSAGANLAVSLVDRVKNKPKKIILISPAAGLENGKDREVRLSMEQQDPLLTVAMNDMIAENWARGVELSSPLINPEAVCYKDFPEIFMCYGSHELFYPHVKRLIEKIRNDGGKVETVEKPMCHDWALCSFFSEGLDAIEKMCGFIVES